MHEVFASLYNDRAIAYRVHQDFDHALVALSVGVQHMVRSDLGASGVMFTLDTESGFRDVVFITASYGLGETVVQGAVNPDEFYVYKPALRAGKQAVLRRNLGAKEIRMVYAEAGLGRARAHGRRAGRRRARASRSPTPTSRQLAQPGRCHRAALRPADGHRVGQGRHRRPALHPAGPAGDRAEPRRPHAPALHAQEHARSVLAEGRSIGQRIGAGPARIIRDVAEMTRVQPGDVLVADMTDPDWEPVMKRASAIVTNRGGRTCHAAIIARELGIPAVVGCGDATEDRARRQRR